MVYRIYVEKKPGFDGEAQGLKHELVELVGIKGLKALRLLNRYDVEGIDRDLFEKAIPTVFSEPPVDVTYTELPTAKTVFAVEYLPGQFDQRADSASECIQLLSQGERPSVRSARIYLLDGELSAEDLEHIGTQVELSNTYHLHLRPGDETVKAMGGLHLMMAQNPIYLITGE